MNEYWKQFAQSMIDHTRMHGTDWLLSEIRNGLARDLAQAASLSYIREELEAWTYIVLEVSDDDDDGEP